RLNGGISKHLWSESVQAAAYSAPQHVKGALAMGLRQLSHDFLHAGVRRIVGHVGVSPAIVPRARADAADDKSHVRGIMDEDCLLLLCRSAKDADAVSVSPLQVFLDDRVGGRV